MDDFVVIAQSKKRVTDNIPRIREYLAGVGLTLHPHKSYLQHYTKGVQFLGAIIKPHRLYPGERIRRNVIRYKVPKKTEEGLAGINSYLGLLRQFRSRLLRRLIADKAFAAYHDEVYFDKDYSRMVVYERKRKPAVRQRRPHGLQVIYQWE